MNLAPFYNSQEEMTSCLSFLLSVLHLSRTVSTCSPLGTFFQPFNGERVSPLPLPNCMANREPHRLAV